MSAERVRRREVAESLLDPKMVTMPCFCIRRVSSSILRDLGNWIFLFVQVAIFPQAEAQTLTYLHERQEKLIRKCQTKKSGKRNQ